MRTSVPSFPSDHVKVSPNGRSNVAQPSLAASNSFRHLSYLLIITGSDWTRITLRMSSGGRKSAGRA
jgi:hypothetical protein